MTDNKTLAKRIFNEVKRTLADARKENKEKGLAIGLWSRRRQQADIEVWDNDTWKDGNRITESYTIKVEGKDMGKVKYRTDIESVFRELRTLLDTQRKVKGWSSLNYTEDKLTYGFGWNTISVRFISKVCLADAPCSEYKPLVNFINKYGKDKYGRNLNLGNYEFFSAAMGGKRGYLWDEYGERIFLDNKPKKCVRLLDELRKARSTKDTMTCERGEENYIDPTEQRYSEYHEVECEGEKRKYILITIKTPTGKVKYEQKIY